MKMRIDAAIINFSDSQKKVKVRQHGVITEVHEIDKNGNSIGLVDAFDLANHFDCAEAACVVGEKMELMTAEFSTLEKFFVEWYL